MPKPTSHFVCQSCGASFPKWSGRCDACGGWNTLLEETATAAPPKGLGPRARKGSGIEFVPLSGTSQPPPRRLTGISELDRVAGGGFVAGSVILIGGDPGIGKSTLLLQTVCHLAQSGQSCVYISGEEGIEQVRMRARRLGLEKSAPELANATSVREIVASLDTPNAPAIAVIDSIQTMYLDMIESAPGTVAQVRASAQELIRVAKKRDITLLLVGHVTKEGTLAGPRVLEHMVDTVLYLEGERGHHFRILRGVKNRFGPTDEIGVFEMTDMGLTEVPNPSALFLADRRDDVSGAAVFAGLEGTRPVLMEIQALVAPSSLGTPRRAVVGWDSARLAMILAVLEARCGVIIGLNDIYLNVAGGLKITEPAADLAVAAALLSSLGGLPVPSESVVFGEIGLAGEIRPVSQPELRLKEAGKLGFTRAFLPRPPQQKPKPDASLQLTRLNNLSDLLPLLLPPDRMREIGKGRT
jgi:DNA repair protein RadA/Sms